ncbi:MAG: hypothetical protein M3238_02915, partial [Actinomycetota bacterium]|nr:hypothetical protein [Actinomycetota bacterium]
VEDRIELWLTTPDPEIARALERHLDLIAREVLATSAQVNENAPGDAHAETVEVETGTVGVALKKA